MNLRMGWRHDCQETVERGLESMSVESLLKLKKLVDIELANRDKENVEDI